MSAHQPGFLQSLFEGRVTSDLLVPFPAPDEETLEMAESIVEMIHDWAEGSIDAAQFDQDKAIPKSVSDGLAELGLFGLTVPEEHGGAGMGQYVYSRAMEAVAHHCASTVTILGAHLGIGIKGLLLDGTDEQKAKWLPKLASGEWTGAFALTEANAGSDAGALRTRATELDDGSWKLDGRKVWITCGATADFLTVFARTAPVDGSDVPFERWPISAFVVPADTPGVEPGLPENKMGLCGSNTVEVGLDGVVIPADHLLGKRGEGFKLALRILNGGRHGLAATCIGQAKLARDLALVHAGEREQFGRPIGEFGMMQELLAGMEADIYSMEAATWWAAGSIDAGSGDPRLEAACCKIFATERLWQVANDALQVTGGTGFMREYAFERIVRDARINMIFEGTNQILRMMLVTQGARNLLKGTASPGDPASCLSLGSPEFEAEAREFTDRAQRFAALAQSAVEAEGAALREAQFTLRRLADLAVALFTEAAVLARMAHEAPTAGETKQATGRLALARRAAEFEAAHREALRPADDLVRTVAGAMTRRAG